jgi:hypothetical protein
MCRNRTAGSPRQDRAWVTAAEWFAGGQRIWYDPESARVLTNKEVAAIGDIAHRHGVGIPATANP